MTAAEKPDLTLYQDQLEQCLRATISAPVYDLITQPSTDIQAVALDVLRASRAICLGEERYYGLPLLRRGTIGTIPRKIKTSSAELYPSSLRAAEIADNLSYVYYERGSRMLGSVAVSTLFSGSEMAVRFAGRVVRDRITGLTSEPYVSATMAPETWQLAIGNYLAFHKAGFKSLMSLGQLERDAAGPLAESE